MGHGGHHGGGFHSGGHHGGGGFHGGGFSGGGGGFHSSYHGGGGGYHGGGGGDISSEDAGFVAGTLGAVALVYMYIMAAEGSLPGFELGNLTIFVVCAILLAIGMGNNERMSSIQDLRGHPHRVSSCPYNCVNSK